MVRRHVSRWQGLQRWSWVDAIAIGWTAGLLLVLWLPGDSIPGVESGFPWSLPEGTDKGVHAFLFFFETLWLILAFRLSRFWQHAVPQAVGIAILLAIVSEVGQIWVPARDGQFADGIADLSGVAIGVLCSRFKFIQSSSYRELSEI